MTKNERMETVGKITTKLIIVVGVAIILCFPTMWLWNWLMPSIFGLTKITIWQAFGLNVLSKIFFKHGSK